MTAASLENYDRLVDRLCEGRFLARGDAAPWRGSVAPFRPASAFDASPLSILTDRLPAAVIALRWAPVTLGLDALGDRFGLSPAERRVAEARYSGSTLQSYVEERGLQHPYGAQPAQIADVQGRRGAPDLTCGAVRVAALGRTVAALTHCRVN